MPIKTSLLINCGFISLGQKIILILFTEYLAVMLPVM